MITSVFDGLVTTINVSDSLSEGSSHFYSEVKRVKEAGYLHDIGKIVLDEKIVRSQHLSEAELEIKRQHPVVGYRILNLFDNTLDLAEAVYSHHENWDGTGYPKGLKGEEIPITGRIIAVAEVYDELTNEYGNLHFDNATALQKAFTVSTFQEKNDFLGYISAENLSWSSGLIKKYGIPGDEQTAISVWRVGDKNAEGQSASVNVTYYFKEVSVPMSLLSDRICINMTMRGGVYLLDGVLLFRKSEYDAMEKIIQDIPE